MPVSVTCRCGHRFKVAAELAGRRVRCPACREPVAVPDPDRDDDDEEPRLKKKAKRRDPEDDAEKALDRDALHHLMPEHKPRPPIGCGMVVLVLTVATTAAVAAVRAAAAGL
ncbi:MAG TPA: hypothetical protein VGF55_03845 [Gemmataceae bacterium]|jgi:hypothetical protein